ncbi:TetR/AcrR family transcriptional regulator [Mycolicibacterium aubagnense]|uniref:TetR/AcrR family transcriptional regulator n=1 Tax=Mycolicibacterium aubagnense TaxID=319707 RepID=UPI0010FDD07A|nr:TetR/AcrR family transcriptional regulator [Mycolicibacterium aubagnense]TLH63220.1 TetR family transcriptional regulator [Mycolicibacterium aubagnense]WGI30529.1 TetR/AcrR family transcriptional regulator [Mycolicibacterium aubagnense]
MSGTSRNRQGNATRAKLVKTAEKLFAEQGVDAVSVRSVNAAAGLGAASVHYHFGSKDELLRAVVLDLGAAVGSAIQANVDVLAADSAAPSPDALVRAVTAPYLDLLRRQRTRGMRWIKIMAQITQAGPADETIEPKLRAALLAQVRRAFPNAAAERLEARWAVSIMGFVQGLSRADEWDRVKLSAPALEAFYEDLVTFVVGGTERLLNS